MTKNKLLFTLVEIVVCLAILAVASALVGIQIRKIVADHIFYKNITSLISELKKCQLVAVCDQTDIEVVISKEGKHYAFWIETDDQLLYFSKRKMLMTGVGRIEKRGKLVDREVVHFYPSGRFDPRTFELFHGGVKACIIDMARPLIIEHKLSST
jgi:prepilin-type N-terminal cleavage/methylation domain-containing protein